MSATNTVREVHLYLHTHWDREWYRSFEGYRYRLIRSLQEILVYLEAHPDQEFLLDGQTVVLEDYLALYPQDQGRIARLIQAGRLHIGPWYVLPDEFLVSGEALIRNLQVGLKQSRALGQTRFCAYLPDMFGHPAQIPQILQQSGLSPAVIWRGVQPDSAYFSWKGLAGEPLPTQHLTKGYYQDALHMENPDKALMASFLEAIAAATPEDLPLLLPVGADHMGLPRDFEAKYKWLQETFPDYHFRQSTLLDYLAALPPVKDTSPNATGNTYTGELRQPDGAYVLPGVWSARYPLKAANARCQRLLERETEPLLAFQQLSGAQAPLWPVLHQAWKTLLLNHPHDSICGCSIDAVHEDMFPRFRWVEQMAAELRQDALIHWGGHQLGQAPGQHLNVVNLGSEAYHGYIDVKLVFPEVVPSVQLRSPEGHLCPLWILPPDPEEKHPDEVFVAEPEILPHWEDVHRVRCRIYVELPPVSQSAFAIETPAVDVRQPTHHADEVHIRDQWGMLNLNNDKVRVRFDAQQRHLIFERKIDQVWIHQVSGHFFVHEGDAGDEYNFSPPQHPAQPALESFGFQEATVYHGPGEQVLTLLANVDMPVGLNTERSARSIETTRVRIETRIRLMEHSETFAFETTVHNSAKDYRLRLFWLPALPPTQVRSSTLLGGITQQPPLLAPWDSEKSKERPVDEFPFQEWIHVKQPDQNGWCFQSFGLYEAGLSPWEDEPALSVTLLRSVGWLSRDDLRTRGGGAGPRMPTPDAQCLGSHSYRYQLHLSGANEDRTLKRVHRFRHRLLAYQGKPSALSRLFEGNTDALHLSALKMADEHPQALVMRWVNESTRTQNLQLRPCFDWKYLYLSNPLEAPLQCLHTAEAQTPFTYTVAPGEIVTFLIAKETLK